VDTSVLLFEGQSLKLQSVSCAVDPYVKNGLVTRWREGPGRRLSENSDHAYPTSNLQA
jgi:hypothetical protein